MAFNRKLEISYWLLLLSILSALSACFNPLEGGKGIITINLGGASARNVMPWPTTDTYLLDNIDYEITITGHGAPIQFTAKSNEKISRTVPAAGYYKVEIKGYLQGGDTPLTPERILYASGENTVEVKAGQENKVTVTLKAEFCRACHYQITEADCIHPRILEIVSCDIGAHIPSTENITPALGHIFSTTAATCTTPSVPGACIRAGCSVTDPVPIVPALGHDHTSSLICKRTGCTHQYAIGDTGPAGGIIIYVADGQSGRQSNITVEGYTGTTGSFATYTAYYLEAAPANESGFWISWSTNRTQIAGVTTFANTADPNASLLGNGRKDTYTIVDYLNDIPESDTAAQLCADKNLNNYADWFLPSLGELNKLYEAQGLHANIPTAGGHWSSSQVGSNYAWGQYFDTGLQGSGEKDTINFGQVRAIRAF